MAELDLLLEPVPGGLGMEVRAAIPRLLQQPAAARALRQALLDHHLLLLRGWTCSPTDLVALGRLFGEPEAFGPRHLPGHPFVARVTNQPGDGFLNNIGQYWHADGTIFQSATAVSLWQVVRPGRGGDTLFADMHRALEELPAPWREALEGLRMVSRSGAVHPVVRPHPVTGRLALYTSLGMTDQFEGLTPAESRAWLDRIGRHLDRPGGHLRHAWRAGDLMIGDNFSVAHQATPSDPQVRRILHRVTIRGDLAFYLRGA